VEHLRRAVHDAHAALVTRFDPLRAEGINAELVLDLTDAGPTTVTIADGRCTIRTGVRASDPAVIYRTEAAVWLDLIEGRVRGMDAFLAGALKVTGDLHLATRFETLFRRLPGQPRVEVTHTRVRGLRIEALVAGEGEGPPVVLLHGLGANKVSFLPTLSALADTTEVHAIDLPGFGGSSTPLPTGRRYSMPWFADVVNGYLIARGLDAAHLVGNSMGGRIAQEVALRHPRSTHSIVGLGPAVGFDLTRVIAPALRYSRPQWGGLARVPLPRQTVERLVRDLFADPDVLPPEHHRAAAEDVLAAWQRPGYRLALLAAARHLGLERGRGPTAYWKRLRRLEVPSLWVFGESDRLVASRYAARVTAALPDAEVQTWPDVGHVPQFEAPRRVAAVLQDWLARTSPPGSWPQAAVDASPSSQAAMAAR
jgi:pimeloyl-ACP methyl ester carboxylesterase/putative sterol carrier protein